jgi:hypothetical protein
VHLQGRNEWSYVLAQYTHRGRRVGAGARYGPTLIAEREILPKTFNNYKAQPVNAV